MSRRDQPQPTTTLSRRAILIAGTASGALAGAATTAHAADVPGRPGRDYTPVVVPNGSKLPWTVVDGVKVFHLTAEPLKREFVRRRSQHA